MQLTEAWVTKCYKCDGVDMGPSLDDGVMAIDEENAVWHCMGCRSERDFSRHDPLTEIRLRGVSDSLMLRKSRTLSYDEFMSWDEEQESW